MTDKQLLAVLATADLSDQAERNEVADELALQGREREAAILLSGADALYHAGSIWRVAQRDLDDPDAVVLISSPADGPSHGLDLVGYARTEGEYVYVETMIDVGAASGQPATYQFDSWVWWDGEGWYVRLLDQPGDSWPNDLFLDHASAVGRFLSPGERLVVIRSIHASGEEPRGEQASLAREAS